MQKAFNARFLIGLPLWKPDSVHLARRMIELTEQYLPKEAILGYELGNEVRSAGARGRHAGLPLQPRADGTEAGLPNPLTAAGRSLRCWRVSLPPFSQEQAACPLARAVAAAAGTPPLPGPPRPRLRPLLSPNTARVLAHQRWRLRREQPQPVRARL
jgi:hypothetical protein